MNKRFFTLIELVSAMAILALTATVTASALAVFMNTYKTTQKTEKEIQRNLAMDRMANTLFAGAVPFMWPDTDKENTNRLVFSGETGELWISAIRPAATQSEGAFIFARIYLENGNLCADTNTRPLLPWQEISTQNHSTEVIAENVESIEFYYAAYDTTETEKIVWYENWDESTAHTQEEEPVEIPVAIALKCVFSDNSELSWLRRTSGSSSVTTLEVSIAEDNIGGGRQ